MENVKQYRCTLPDDIMRTPVWTSCELVYILQSSIIVWSLKLYSKVAYVKGVRVVVYVWTVAVTSETNKYKINSTISAIQPIISSFISYELDVDKSQKSIHRTPGGEYNN